jgi:lysozyme
MPVRLRALLATALAVAVVTPTPAVAFENGRAAPSDLAPVFIPPNAPPGKVDFNTAYLKRGETTASWNTMRRCAALSGVDLYPGSSIRKPAMTAYRDLAGQQYVWQLYVSGRGAPAAVPGTSNHGWALAVDLDTLRQRAWIDHHGGQFGWAKAWSDAPTEWWHLRYRAGVWHPRPDPGTSLRFPNLRTGSGGPCQASAVREVQRRLGVSPRDGDYGKTTRRAVKRFQRKYHLHVDGRVGSDTWLKLRKVGRDLSAGTDPRTVAGNLPGQSAPMKGVDVKVAQGLLNTRFVELGHPGWQIKADGLAGPTFTRAVKRFQRLVHLPVTGRVGDKTYAELLKRRAAPEPRLSVSIEGTNLIADFEGFRSCPYRDAVGVWTIGYGHTAGVNSASRCLSLTEARALLRTDLGKFGLGVTRLVKVDVSGRQYNALVSIGYNVGLGQNGLGGSTLMRELNATHYANAGNQFKRWDRAGGRVLPGLTTRRRVECELYARGSRPATRRHVHC